MIALSGCGARAPSPVATVEVGAYVESGRLSFRLDPARPGVGDCIDNFQLINAHGEVVAELSPDPVAKPHRDCIPVFPFQYGVTPPGAMSNPDRVPPLKPGESYFVEAAQRSGYLTGAFRLGADGQTVARIDPDGAEMKAMEANRQQVYDAWLANSGLED